MKPDCSKNMEREAVGTREVVVQKVGEWREKEERAKEREKERQK